MDSYYLMLMALLLGNWTLCVISNADNRLAKTEKIWSKCDGNGSCVCGNSLNNAVQCHDSDETILIKLCYCMYYDEEKNESILGKCMPTCFYLDVSYPITRYSVQNASMFNDDVCNKQAEISKSNREGRFCGRCKEGYGLAAYSYHYTTCIPCTDYGYKNWIKYFTIALLPLTLFYFLVVILRINVASSRLNGIVFMMQCALSPTQLRIYNGWMNARYALDEQQGEADHINYLNIVYSILGIVNLDFFRDVYPDFCLHPRMNILHVVSLDYIVALYPFLLIFITYMLINMYDNNYRLLVWAWKPFKWFLRHYQSHFTVGTSLVETFATFIFLSNVKILGVSFDLLISTKSYDVTGNLTKQRFLYYDATIEYFSREHLPFAVLALSVGFVFVFFPFLLLVLYPCRCFQKCLNHFGYRCQVLHVFMDAFQGSYKTEPYDLRYFSAFYLALRFFINFFIGMILTDLYIPIAAMVLVIGAFIFTLFQPYKIKSHNKLDMTSLFLSVTFFVEYAAIIMITYSDPYWGTTIKLLFAVTIVGILIYIIVVFIWIIFGTALKKIYRKLRNCRQPSDTSRLPLIQTDSYS